MREINYLRSQERWGFWAGCIATCEDAMITASDALNSVREKIRVRLTRVLCAARLIWKRNPPLHVTDNTSQTYHGSPLTGQVGFSTARLLKTLGTSSIISMQQNVKKLRFRRRQKP
jgi:hypothetical protein